MYCAASAPVVDGDRRNVCVLPSTSRIFRLIWRREGEERQGEKLLGMVTALTCSSFSSRPAILCSFWGNLKPVSIPTLLIPTQQEAKHAECKHGNVRHNGTHVRMMHIYVYDKPKCTRGTLMQETCCCAWLKPKRKLNHSPYMVSHVCMGMHTCTVHTIQLNRIPYLNEVLYNNNYRVCWIGYFSRYRLYACTYLIPWYFRHGICTEIPRNTTWKERWKFRMLEDVGGFVEPLKVSGSIWEMKSYEFTTR